FPRHLYPLRPITLRPDKPGDQFGAVALAKLAQHVIAMGFDAASPQLKLLADLSIDPALRTQCCNPALARGQVGASGFNGAGQGVEAVNGARKGVGRTYGAASHSAPEAGAIPMAHDAFVSKRLATSEIGPPQVSHHHEVSEFGIEDGE